MNKQFTKRTILTVTVLIAALAFLSFFGVQTVKAETSLQQQNAITGTVIDNHGEPIIGATVVVVGGNAAQGTVTDFNGVFKVNAKTGVRLKISYVGYDAQTIVARNGMKVVLAENSTMLQGVEVVAYGTQKKVSITGALSSVQSDDLVRTPVGSVNNILAGQLSGVTTIQYSGEPGSDAAKIFVRGQGTFTNSEPLIQVDGVERSMSDIDPNEIESITVLKDASATAVFGIRGANGVVLVTTKRGKEGKTKITASTSFSALTPTKMVEQANSYDYATFYNQMCANDGKSSRFSDAVLEKFRTNSDPIRFPSTQWADYIMKDVTLTTQHNVNISGGTDRARYFISAGYYTVGGLFNEFDSSYNYGYQYDRFNYRSNLDLDVTKSTTISLNIAGVVDNSDKPYTGQGSSGMIKNMYYATPFSSPGIVDGKYIVNTTSTSDNGDGSVLPFTGSTGMTYYGAGFMQTNNNKLQFDLGIDQKLDFITKGLVWRAKGTYNSSFTVYKQGSATVATYTPVWQTDGSLLYRKNSDTTVPSYSSSTGRSRDWYFETALSYNHSFGNHNITALALYNQSRQYYFSGSSSVYYGVPRGYVGFVGRVTYDWKNRYLAELNFGYNGSENFASDKRFGSFPAGSLGWVISDEPFFKPLKKIISFMKLRASIGKVGNDKGADVTSRFYYLPDQYSVNQSALFNRTGKDTGAYGYNFGVENGTTTNGTIESTHSNYDVTWETAIKQNYGVDVNFLNDRLRASFDYYREHRTNILVVDNTAPTTLGFDLPYANLGIMDSHGYEISLNWNDKIGQDFRYWGKLNLSYNQNEVVEMKETPQTNEYMYVKGHRYGSRSLYKFWKFYYDGCEADYKKEFGYDFPTQMVSSLKPGDAVFVDLDHNGKIDGNDKSYDNTSTDDPKYIAGLSLGFSWKGWTFNTQFTAAWDVSRLISDVFRQPFYSSASSTEGGLLAYHISHTWTEANPSQDSEYPRATWDNAVQNYADCTLYEKDSKYLRLKTIQLAYDFNMPWMKRLGLTQLQLGVSGYNLFTITPYLWGDPETRASNAPSYPLQRTYTVSLKVGF